MATLKRSIASLVGGIAVGIFIFGLWLLIAGSPSPAAVVLGLVLAVLVGGWVRLADL
jgi:multisubunit Na+/H+ antiporter MnhE subunit